MNNTLTNQFNSVLSQYQETYQKFLDSLNDINSNVNLVTLENSALFGGDVISKNKLSNITDCLTTCTTDMSCNGANFYTEDGTCSTIKNPKNVIPANKTTALVNPALYYNYQLQQLNKQLTDINKQIIILVNQQDNSNNSDKILNQQKIVTNNFNILNEERDKIMKMNDELNTINSANINSSLNVSMYYYRYIILLFIVGLMIFILISFSSSEQRGGGNNFKRDSIFLLLIIIFCLGVSQK
jgi:lipopolysaccharide export LptBFGC system permease protein LptF